MLYTSMSFSNIAIHAKNVLRNSNMIYHFKISSSSCSELEFKIFIESNSNITM